jgi:ribosomal protein RSM22 (predicted rRNA methylase)
MNRPHEKATQLFPLPGQSLTKGMVLLQEQIKRAFPLKAKHLATLPGTVRRLSAFLTVERENLPRDYMTRPEYLAAYLNYFLPWNIYRQGRLLQGLQLDLPEGARILDLGSGPLTFLQSMWLARPQLRGRALEYIAVDRSESALKAGRRILEGLQASDREDSEKSAWKVRTSRSLSEKGRARADLLVAANFINELEGDSRGRQRRDAAEEGEASSEELLLEKWEQQVADNGAILLIEPAMRATSRRVSRVRQAALGRGWQVAAPCPHHGDCPMPGVRGGPWCHFNFRPDGAPDWLTRFSRSVRLPKERGSLSFLLLTRGEACPVTVAVPGPARGNLMVRAISEPFDLPDWNQGSYGCCEKGLVLLQDRKSAPAPAPRPGQLIEVSWPDRPEKDAKSGAWIVPAKKR